MIISRSLMPTPPSIMSSNDHPMIISPFQSQTIGATMPAANIFNQATNPDLSFQHPSHPQQQTNIYRHHYLSNSQFSTTPILTHASCRGIEEGVHQNGINNNTNPGFPLFPSSYSFTHHDSIDHRARVFASYGVSPRPSPIPSHHLSRDSADINSKKMTQDSTLSHRRPPPLTAADNSHQFLPLPARETTAMQNRREQRHQSNPGSAYSAAGFVSNHKQNATSSERQLESHSGAAAAENYPEKPLSAINPAGQLFVVHKFPSQHQEQQQTSTFNDPGNEEIDFSLHEEYERLRTEYKGTMAKLTEAMDSIKTFWSPQLKSERLARKQDRIKLDQCQSQLRQLSEENVASTEQKPQDTSERDSSPEEEDQQAGIGRQKRLRQQLSSARETISSLQGQVDDQRRLIHHRDEIYQHIIKENSVAEQDSHQATADFVHNEIIRVQAENDQLSYHCSRLEEAVKEKEADVRTLQIECLNASDRLHQQMTLMMQVNAHFDVDNDDINNPDDVKVEDFHSRRQANCFQQLLDSKEARIEELEGQLAIQKAEMKKVLEEDPPREYTKTNGGQEEDFIKAMKLKLETTERLVSERQKELDVLRLSVTDAEEAEGEWRKKLTLFKEENNVKCGQIKMLQEDIEALRAKLAAGGQDAEQKQTALDGLQAKLRQLTAENGQVTAKLATKDEQLCLANRKVEGLEELLKERESTLTSLKTEMDESAVSGKMRQIAAALEESILERDRIQQEFSKKYGDLEHDVQEQEKNRTREIKNLRTVLDSLQTDINDRQVLIESQNEKISELNRDLDGLRSQAIAGNLFKTDADLIASLQADVHLARSECERLLRHRAEYGSEIGKLTDTLRETERELVALKHSNCATGGIASGRTGGTGPGTTDYDIHSNLMGSMEKERQNSNRIRELEEALRESVSMTADKELAIVQQKHYAQTMEARTEEEQEETEEESPDAAAKGGWKISAKEMKRKRMTVNDRREVHENQRMNEYKEQLGVMSQRYDHLTSIINTFGPTPTFLSDGQKRTMTKVDKDQLAQYLQKERKQHVDDVLKLKQESLLAAISEKDAHIALIEMCRNNDVPNSDRSPEELTSLKRQKDKLMKKLKLQLEQAIRSVELQKKKLRILIDQLTAHILDIDPNLLNGLPRTQQSHGVDYAVLKKLTSQQLLLELEERETDSLQLQSYANQLLSRLSPENPRLTRRALRLLNSFNVPSHTTSLYNLLQHTSNAAAVVTSPTQRRPTTQQPRRRNRSLSLQSRRRTGHHHHHGNIIDDGLHHQRQRQQQQEEVGEHRSRRRHRSSSDNFTNKIPYRQNKRRRSGHERHTLREPDYYDDDQLDYFEAANVDEQRRNEILFRSQSYDDQLVMMTELNDQEEGQQKRMRKDGMEAGYDNEAEEEGFGRQRPFVRRYRKHSAPPPRTTSARDETCEPYKEAFQNANRRERRTLTDRERFYRRSQQLPSEQNNTSYGNYVIGNCRGSSFRRDIQRQSTISSMGGQGDSHRNISQSVGRQPIHENITPSRSPLGNRWTSQNRLADNYDQHHAPAFLSSSDQSQPNAHAPPSVRAQQYEHNNSQVGRPSSRTPPRTVLTTSAVAVHYPSAGLRRQLPKPPSNPSFLDPNSSVSIAIVDSSNKNAPAGNFRAEPSTSRTPSPTILRKSSSGHQQKRQRSVEWDPDIPAEQSEGGSNNVGEQQQHGANNSFSQQPLLTRLNYPDGDESLHQNPDNNIHRSDSSSQLGWPPSTHPRSSSNSDGVGGSRKAVPGDSMMIMRERKESYGSGYLNPPFSSHREGLARTRISNASWKSSKRPRW